MEPFVRCFCTLLTILLSWIIWSFLPPIDNSFSIAAIYILVFFLSIWICYYKLAKFILDQSKAPNKPSMPSSAQSIRSAEEQLLCSLKAMLSLSDSQSESMIEFITLFSDAIRNSKQMSLDNIDSFIDWVFLSGYIKSPFSQHQELGLKISSTCKIHIPAELRTQIPDWMTERNRSLDNGILLTACKSAASIASWNDELAFFLEGLFVKGDQDLLSILERIIELAEEAHDERASFPEYIARLAELPHVSERDIIQATSDQIEAFLRIFAKTLLIDIEPEPHEEYKKLNRRIRCSKRVDILREQYKQHLISEELQEIRTSMRLNK